MINDLFHDLPFDHEPGMKPNHDYANQALNWFKDNASVIGLCLALAVAI